jgi:hypothetical protein
MINAKDPVKYMLNLALATALNDLQFYLDEEAARTAPEVKALLKVLAESEETLIAAIEGMIVGGVTTAMEEVLLMREASTQRGVGTLFQGLSFLHLDFNSRQIKGRESPVRVCRLSEGWTYREAPPSLRVLWGCGVALRIDSYSPNSSHILILFLEHVFQHIIIKRKTNKIKT